MIILRFNKGTNSNLYSCNTSVLVMFAQDVKGVVEVMEKMSNFFLEESKDLLRMDTTEIVDAAVTSTLCQAKKIGQ